MQVLGVAAQLMAMHSLELAAAEAAVSLSGKGSTDHWKPWMRDGLDVLESTLGEPRRVSFVGPVDGEVKNEPYDGVFWI